MIKLIDLLLESRVDDFKRKYNNIPDEIKDKVIKVDPSSNHKYLDWIGKAIITDPKVNLNILLKDLNDFDRYSLGDIYKYKSYDDLKKFLSTRQKSKKEATREDANIIIDDENFLVVAPRSHDSCGYYGNNTKWCIVGSESYWNDYYYQNSIVIVIDKRHDDEKYAVVGPSSGQLDVYNKQDNRLDYNRFIGNDDEEDEWTWPEYIHSAIRDYVDSDDIVDREANQIGYKVNDYIEENGVEYVAEQIFTSYLEEVHEKYKLDFGNKNKPESTIDEGLFIDILQNKYNWDMASEDFRYFIKNYMIANGEEYSNNRNNVTDLTVVSGMEDFFEKINNDNNKNDIINATNDYVDEIKKETNVMNIIKQSIRPELWNQYNTGLFYSFMKDIINRYNQSLNDPKQLKFKGIESKPLKVKINNINDIISILNKLGYDEMADKMKNNLIRENIKRIKLKSMLLKRK